MRTDGVLTNKEMICALSGGGGGGGVVVGLWFVWWGEKSGEKREK